MEQLPDALKELLADLQRDILILTERVETLESDVAELQADEELDDHDKEFQMDADDDEEEPIEPVS